MHEFSLDSQNTPNFRAIYSKKYTGLQKVHHRRFWQLWLISALWSGRNWHASFTDSVINKYFFSTNKTTTGTSWSNGPELTCGSQNSFEQWIKAWAVCFLQQAQCHCGNIFGTLRNIQHIRWVLSYNWYSLHIRCTNDICFVVLEEGWGPCSVP